MRCKACDCIMNEQDIFYESIRYVYDDNDIKHELPVNGINDLCQDCRNKVDYDDDYSDIIDDIYLAHQKNNVDF